MHHSLEDTAVRLLAAVAICVCALDAGAQEQPSAFYYGTALTTAYDSNVTRQPEGAGAAGSHIDSAALLAGFDRIYDRQHVTLAATVSRVMYRQMSLYDYTMQNLHLGLNS